MIAVVEIGGKQYTVEKDMSLVVDRQHSDVGSTITIPALLVASADAVSYTHLRAHETVLDLVCRLLLDTKHNAPRVTNSNWTTLID